MTPLLKAIVLASRVGLIEVVHRMKAAPMPVLMPAPRLIMKACSGAGAGVGVEAGIGVG